MPKNINDSNKIHIGILPPPLGGISVYLHRLKKLNPNDTFIDIRYTSRWNLLKLFFTSNKEIIIEGINWKLLFALSIIKQVKQNLSYSVVLHGQGWLKDYQHAHPIKRFFIKASIMRSTSVQLVAQHLENDFLTTFINYKGTVTIKDAFIPPPMEEESDIFATYDKETVNFIHSHHQLIVANAFQLADWNGVDLYGLDLCIELISRLKSDYPNLGLLFALANQDYRKDYLHQLKQTIATKHLCENIHFLSDQHELWPIIKRCSIFVRPTCTDGFALSIAEALYFNKPVVASDIVQRPAGCTTFQNRSIDDFENKVRCILGE